LTNDQYPGGVPQPEQPYQAAQHYVVPPEPRSPLLPPLVDAAQPLAAPVARRSRTGAWIATIAGIALLFGGAGTLGHGLWVLTQNATSSSSRSIDLGAPGHGLPLPQVARENNLDVTSATAAESVGVVTILTDMYYDDQSQAAGTGSVLTDDGQVLTNNHVIEGSTKIEVTIESTGDVYYGLVLGTDKTKDVALLQLVDDNGDEVTGLDTVTLNYDDPEIGDRVRSVGNALGTGDLVTATGDIVSLGESLSISDGYGAAYEELDNLIEIDADVVSGDSGGPLIDEDGEVIGMVTAASTGGNDIRGFAITISDAMDVVEQILDGDDSGTVNIGTTAFLGVTLSTDQTASGVTLDGTIADTPGDKAGLKKGDVITAIDGVAVTSVEELKAAIAAHEAGDRVEISYTDSSGVERTVEATLTEGPA
jgi:S1-C subfamily serine protease